MARTAYLPNQYPDPHRIVGISASIALNACLFLFLMQPPGIPTTPEKPDVETYHPVDPIRPLPVEPPRPTPPRPPEIHLRDPHPPTPPLTRPVRPRVIDPDPSPMGFRPDPVVDPLPNPQPPPVIPTGPVEASLTAIDAPVPPYPRDELKDGITGEVQLELLVGADGHVLEVKVVHSSGNHHLDTAAREQVLRNWRFKPAMVNGVPVPSLGRVPIVFTLDGQ